MAATFKKKKCFTHFLKTISCICAVIIFNRAHPIFQLELDPKVEIQVNKLAPVMRGFSIKFKMNI